MKEKQAEASNENLKYIFYELHDGKMLYLLTQHSLHNRKNKPFLLCECCRGDGVVNKDHECKPFTEEEHIFLWERSLCRWNHKQKRIQNKEEYEYFDHMKWVDEMNLGISHFGIHPRNLPRDSLQFDALQL